jgi:hypothetical protein
MPLDDSNAAPRDHRRILATCWIIYGLIRLAIAVWLIGFSGRATLMFGTLVGRVADPYTLMSMFHFAYAANIILSALCGLCGLLGGFLLPAGKQTGRTLVLIAAFLALSNIPVGTTLGIYTLVIFFAAAPNRSPSTRANA